MRSRPIPSLENPVLPVHPKALLALADGTVFTGIAIGATGQTVGEVVFNTSLTGYQEILTDPSYCQQIVTLTYPTSVIPASTRKTWRLAGSMPQA